MPFTHTLGVSYKTDAGTISNTTVAYTGNGEINIDVLVPAPSTNYEIDLGSIVPATIKSMVLVSSLACTVHTNSPTTGDEDIALLAGKQIVWDVDTVAAVPFSTTLTKFYVDLVGTVAARLRMSILFTDTL